jgi:hypothetical protein
MREENWRGDIGKCCAPLSNEEVSVIPVDAMVLVRLPNSSNLTR